MMALMHKPQRTMKQVLMYKPWKTFHYSYGAQNDQDTENYTHYFSLMAVNIAKWIESESNCHLHVSCWSIVNQLIKKWKFKSNFD